MLYVYTSHYPTPLYRYDILYDRSLVYIYDYCSQCQAQSHVWNTHTLTNLYEAWSKVGVWIIVYPLLNEHRPWKSQILNGSESSKS